MKYKDLKKIINDIFCISKFPRDYFNMFYFCGQKKINQSIEISINFEKFIKLYKNKTVIIENEDYKRLYTKYGTGSLYYFYDEDTVINTVIRSENKKYIKQIKNLQIIKEKKEVKKI